MVQVQRRFSYYKFLKTSLVLSLTMLTIFGYILVNSDYFFPVEIEKFYIEKSAIVENTRLVNTSVYCYMNTTLQILYRINSFKEHIHSKRTTGNQDSFYFLLQRIFSLMDASFSVDLTPLYEKFISLIAVKYKSANLISKKSMECSFQLLQLILSALINEDKDDFDIQFYKNYNSIGDSWVRDLFFLKLNSSDKDSTAEVFIGIDDTKNALNLQAYINDLYTGNTPKITNPLPAVLALQNINNEGEYYIHYAKIPEYLTVGTVKYKFFGYSWISKRPISGDAGGHYIACILYKDMWIYLNDESEITYTKPKYNEKISSVYGIFYIREEQ
ncbi:hypothetical protein NCER_100496 [Vairimorpha ceranae BRL01]|uniref:USP domain-containing protein n=2 Tax=Vairimorpha ceranae TaxID=40302 RepID=C4V7Q9_VAIC1|nr:hypothetical protein AAJ76_3000023942 [Vairimorpha ceranae]EEQ82750.1 hypothetical protein NCER_100496 [Vairimorpha ceranae BRL01]KKO75152.1 hypothetical protein AAJ76_3000023942 [Vairimorpha ceranae]